MRAMIAGVVALLMLGGCSSLQVESDYDPETAFGKLHSYALLEPLKTEPLSLSDERVERAITEHLEAKGYRSAPPEAADFHVRYETGVVHDVPGSFSFGFGFGSFSSHGGGSVSASKSPLYDAVTLRIDMIAPYDGRTLWSGSAQEKVSPRQTPRERQEQANRLVDALLEQFPAE